VQEQTKSKLLLGTTTNCTCYQSASVMTGSLSHSIEANGTRSWEHLQQPSERVDFLLQNLLHSEVVQSEPPWIVYHRPLDWPTSQTQDSTSTATLHSFYNANLDVTQLQTLARDNKLQLQVPFFTIFTNLPSLQWMLPFVNFSSAHSSLL
jgi:hypothetical protein